MIAVARPSALFQKPAKHFVLWERSLFPLYKRSRAQAPIVSTLHLKAAPSASGNPSIPEFSFEQDVQAELS